MRRADLGSVLIGIVGAVAIVAAFVWLDSQKATGGPISTGEWQRALVGHYLAFLFAAAAAKPVSGPRGGSRVLMLCFLPLLAFPGLYVAAGFGELGPKTMVAFSQRVSVMFYVGEALVALAVILVSRRIVSKPAQVRRESRPRV